MEMGRRSRTRRRLRRGLLSLQYRMHPDIGQLVSRCLYKEAVRDATKAEDLAHGMIAPEELHGNAVVWIDLPFAGEDARFAERPYYSNLQEELAIRGFIDRLQIDPELEKLLEEPLNLAVLSPQSRRFERLPIRLAPKRGRYGNTRKGALLKSEALGVTTRTVPVVAPAGTLVKTAVPEELTVNDDTAVPLNVILVVPSEPPKLCSVVSVPLAVILNTVPSLPDPP
jgi:hypothetical protein